MDLVYNGSVSTINGHHPVALGSKEKMVTEVTMTQENTLHDIRCLLTVLVRAHTILQHYRQYWPVSLCVCVLLSVFLCVSLSLCVSLCISVSLFVSLRCCLSLLVAQVRVILSFRSLQATTKLCRHVRISWLWLHTWSKNPWVITPINPIMIIACQVVVMHA